MVNLAKVEIKQLTFHVKKTYKGCISLRSYLVDKYIEQDACVRVEVEGESSYMLLTPLQLANPDNRSKAIPSQFEGNEDYYLLDYKWNPISINKKEQDLIKMLGREWYQKIGYIFDTDWMKKLAGFLQKERLTKKIYPSSPNVFKAFSLTPYSEVKVVILSQGLYSGGNGDGLAFSCSSPTTPKSLQIIFQEIKNSIPTFNERRDANLEDWAKQGILLLNTLLTVEQGVPNSHKDKGWEIFTENVIKRLNEHPNPLCFALWGKEAAKYAKLIDNKYHLVLTSVHPASEFYNTGSFIGNNHFVEINSFLLKHYNYKITW